MPRSTWPPGATFEGDEANVRVAALNGAGTILTGYPGSGYSTFTVGVDDASGDFSGVIRNDQAAGVLTKIGGGIQVLSGANTYTGGTVVNDGVLQLGNTNALGRRNRPPDRQQRRRGSPRFQPDGLVDLPALPAPS